MYRRNSLRICVLASLGLLVSTGNRSSSQEHISLSPAYVRDERIQADPKLQTSITLDMNGKPLCAVLAAITQQAGVFVRAETNLQEYRVSLHTTAQPLLTIMQRLQDLFGHGDLPNKAYGWTRSVEAGLPHYVLTRNARAYQKEQAMLDLPRVRRIQWLKQIRGFVHLPENKRKAFYSDCPSLQYNIRTGESLDGHPGAEAVAALTDEQMNTLIHEGRVDVPQLVLSSASLAYLQKAVPRGQEVGRDFTDYNPPSHARLSIEEDGKQRAQFRGVSSLSLDFGSGYPRHCPISFAFDTLGQLPDGDPSADDNASSNSPRIDLLAHEPVPQPLLDHWSSSYAQHHRYELQDLIEMACLKEDQQATIIDVLKVQTPFQSQSLYALQLLALISPHDMAQAYTSTGVLMENMDEAHLRLAQHVFHVKAIAMPLTIRLRYYKKIDGRSVQAGTAIDFVDNAGAKAEAWAADYSQLPQSQNK